MEIQYQVEKLYGTDSDPDREDRHRVIPLSSGNKIHLRATDPYGFVYISFDKGPTPAVLAGAYTSFMEANRAVEAWRHMKAQEARIELENQRPKKRVLTPRIQTNDDKTIES